MSLKPKWTNISNFRPHKGFETVIAILAVFAQLARVTTIWI